MSATPTLPVSSDPPRGGRLQEFRRICRWIAALGASFALVICCVLLVEHLTSSSIDPLRATALTALKQKLARNPNDEALKTQIRTLDVRVRQRYFHEQLATRTGCWLALVSAAVALLAAKAARTLGEPLPQPKLDARPEELLANSARRSIWAVALFGVVLAGACAGTALATRTNLPRSALDLQRLLAADTNAPAATPDFASAAEMEQNWPRFRGPLGLGTTASTNFPISWDAKTGEAILWHAPVPAPGHNSPLVWNNRVFLSGGDNATREVFCFDADRGDLVWRRKVGGSAETPGRKVVVPEQTGFAASTMATDGHRVYAIFATGDLAALTLEGAPVWEKSLGIPKNPHGHATSLLTWQGLLLVQFDQEEGGGSKLYAFAGSSGQLVWQRARPVPASWATPIVIQPGGKPQLITLGVPWIISYAPKDGTELWRAEGLANEVTPSPTFGAGLVYAVNPNEKLIAIRPDGQGDVSKTHLAWSAEDNAPDITSPVANDELVFTVTTPGLLTCFDAKDGKKQWEQDLAMECKASPSLVGQRLYLIGSNGVGVVVEAARQFKELSRNDLGTNVLASPAFARGRIYVRTTESLVCVGNSGGKLAQRSERESRNPAAPSAAGP